MPKFKPNTSKAVGKGPYKMKYKHSAFPFKGSPAKEVIYDWEQEQIGGIDASQQTVPSHSHSEMSGGGGGGMVSKNPNDPRGVIPRPAGRRTVPGQV